MPSPLLRCPAVAELPASALSASWGGAEPLRLPSGAAVYGVWEPQAWLLRFTHAVGGVGVAVDPEGDDAAFFEFLLTPEGGLEQAFCRRNRSGWRRHPGWVCEGAVASVESDSVQLRLPFASLSQRRPPAPWRAAFRQGVGRVWPRFGEIYWEAPAVSGR